MKNARMNPAILIYCCTLAFIIAGFFFLNIYCTRSSADEHTYTFAGNYMSISQDGLSISITDTKDWHDDELHPDMPIGAQYDGVLTNSSAKTFHNWKAVIVFSEDTFIDSSWNGEFALDGDTVTFVARDDPATVSAHDKATFGAVMYATQIMAIKSCTVSGYWIIELTDLRTFWGLSGLALLWVIFVITHCIIRMHARNYIRRQTLDSEIIKQSMNTFTGFIDAKDAYTKGHSLRVAAYSTEIARRMKLKPDEIQKLFFITLMHDCGKIGIPDYVLKKPGKLTNEEYKLIQSHTTLGDSILVNFTAIPGIRDGAHYHHERFDGHGYPAGLKGNDIPFYARIICVADSYDAMSTNRCYRRGLSTETILRELTINAGKQFDPQIVPYMIDMINDGFTEKVQAQYPGGAGDGASAPAAS